LSSPSRDTCVRLLVILLLVTIIFMSLFYVVMRSRGQRRLLTLDKDKYQINGYLILTVKNIWKSDILVGVDFGLSKAVNGSWKHVLVPGPDISSDSTYDAAMRILRPGESYSQVINLKGLEAGEYRLKKEIHHTDPDEMRAYYVRFTITG